MNALHETLARASAWLWPSVVNHMWQATLLAALVLCATLLLRDAPARVRFALWLLAALKFALPSALFAFVGAWAGVDDLLSRSGGAATPFVLKFAEPVQTSGADLVVSVSGARGHEELWCVLTLAWVAGSVALFVVWLGRRREFLRSVRGGEEVWSGREFEALRRARARLRMKREVLLALSSGRAEPGVWRTRRPVLVLPPHVSAQLDDEELEAVLLHELAHVERRDNLWSNFQTALECVFWFNPAVWLVGRRLLAERERACDERVLAAGGAAGAYAAGILKVVRFCSGWRVAGVSGAASGSNLRRRIEMIMRGEKSWEARGWHRALASGLCAAALALTVGAGVFSGARRAEARMLEVVEGEGGQQTRVGGIGGGARVVERRGGAQDGPAVRELEQAPESGVYFEQASGAPVQIVEARMRSITREQLRRADEEGADAFDEGESPLFLTLPTLTLANVSGKAVREVGIGFATSGRVNVVAGYTLSIAPGESQTIRSDWRRRNVILPGTASDVKLSLVWVSFTDGTHWGARARPPHAPPPPPPPDGAPSSPDAPPPPPPATGRAVTVVRGVAGSGGGGTGSGVGTSAGVGEGSGVGEGAGAGAAVGGGGDGGVGAGVGRASGGSRKVGGLGGQKLYAPEPSYPEIAKAAGAEGTVSVRITVDEEGNVVAAEAVSGHPLLRVAAVDAARAAKFKPTLVEGKPVKVSGVISYVFTLK